MWGNDYRDAFAKVRETIYNLCQGKKVSRNRLSALADWSSGFVFASGVMGREIESRQGMKWHI
jgi:16S rRNA G966 N2-methylase RsmD